MHCDVKEILLTEEEIAKIVSKIATEIEEDYKDKKLLLVCVLKGSICFMADLMRKINLPMEIEFLRAKSYLAGSSESCGEVQVKSAIDNLDQYDVLVVEDIFDTGRTLQKVKAKMIEDGAKSVRLCSLLDKPERRDASVTIKLDYVGMEIPNEFVVGYGLDFDEKYRSLPYVGILKPEVYSH
jgi:hypoxanthine phosphoribosyltransferase